MTTVTATETKTCEASVGCSRPTATASASFCARHLDAYAAGARDLGVWESQMQNASRRRRELGMRSDYR